MMQRQQAPQEGAMISTAIFNNGHVAERITARVDAATGPAAWQELSALLQRVRAMDCALFMDLESAVIAYAVGREEAGFVTGFTVATQPAPWLFEE